MYRTKCDKFSSELINEISKHPVYKVFIKDFIKDFIIDGDYLYFPTNRISSETDYNHLVSSGLIEIVDPPALTQD
jgi:hypothetical protein